MQIFRSLNTTIIVALLWCIPMSCTKVFKLKEGDFLFQDLDCGPMCNAIEEVTLGIDGARLSHVGLVVLQNDTLKVAEAISAGVVLTPLNDFLSRSSDKRGRPKVLVGRLKKEYKHLTTKAIEKLNNYYQSAYDIHFLMDNNSYYCSELLYQIYKDANQGQEVFNLSPMTFKQPGSNSFYPVWVDYYSQLNEEIPEGKPGINPGGMSRSDYLEIIHAMGEPDGRQKK